MIYKDEYPSALLEEAVDQLSSLPGIGRKTALRLALHILKQPQENVNHFGESFIKMRRDIKYCKRCNMISDTDICSICSDANRDNSLICVVESLRDLLSIESTGEYRGKYFVLGGIISPMDGIGPDDLPISQLEEIIAEGDVKEVIMAIATSIEGETTSFYLYKILSKYQIKLSTIARGVGFGDDLEYTDRLTLGKSIANRQPIQI